MAKKRYFYEFGSRLPSEQVLTSTDQTTSKVIYYEEVDASVPPRAIGSGLAPIGSGLRRWLGNIGGKSTSCGAGSTPVTGAPEWGPLSLATLTPGVYYQSDFSVSVVTTGDGSTPTISMPSGHPYLRLANASAGIVRIYGTPPTDATATSIYLLATQADGKQAPKTQAINVVSATLYATARNFGSTALIWAGPNLGASNLPVITIYKPDGSSSGSESMNYAPNGALLPGKDFGYQTANFNPIPGRYVFRIVQSGLTKWGVFYMPAEASDFLLFDLTDTEPVHDGSTPATSDETDEDTTGFYTAGGVNNAPVVDLPRSFNTSNVGEPATFPMNAGPNSGGLYQFRDPDGNAMTYALEVSFDSGATWTSTLPGWMSKTSTTYTVTGPSAMTFKIRVTATDTGGLSVTDTWNHNVG